MDVEKNIILGLDVLLGHQDEGDTLVGGIWEPKTKAVLVTSLCSGCSSFSWEGKAHCHTQCACIAQSSNLGRTASA
jgi:hypothetical protein